MPKISIVIPSFNHCSDLLKPCLESIIKYTDLTDVEVIIVANGCTDNTREYVESLEYRLRGIDDPDDSGHAISPSPFKLLWFDEGLGYTRATNEGMKIATGEYIIPLNNDVQILDLGQGHNKWLNDLLKPFETDESVGITGPMLSYNAPANRQFLIFFCACIKRKVIDTIGYLDEIFSPGFDEDVDYCARAQDAGFKTVSLPTAFEYLDQNQKRMVSDYPMYHAGNETFKNHPGWAELMARNDAILKQRYNPVDISRASQCDGFMNDGELYWLGKEARKRKVIVEIGSWHGKSSRVLGDNLMEGGVIYCVDTWAGTPIEQDTNHVSARWKDGDHAFYEFMQNNLDLIQQGKIIPLRMNSKNASDLLLEKGVKPDMIFIDADHTYEGVCADIDAWSRLVGDDTLFCGHDLGAWEGVQRAVEEKFNLFYVGEFTTIWFCNKRDIKSISTNKGKIYDCFPFYNEFDLLEARLEELWDVVDYFVICEATLTHGVIPKPLYFKLNEERFKKYLNKIIHVVLDNYPELDKMKNLTDKSWYIERRQRDHLKTALADRCKDEDIIIISDADEIPKADAVRRYNPATGINVFSMDLFYYNLNLQAKDKWDWARILPWGIMKTMTPCDARYFQDYDKNIQTLSNGGWHFSYFGGVEGIIRKIESTAHQDLNLDKFKDRNRIQEIVKAGKDLYDRPIEYQFVAITEESVPRFIFDNLETKYSDYVYKDN
jgi:beta-1,4-mannosyl-glycoprotein beta-1,4-N-acetylglucosaminyltransferase